MQEAYKAIADPTRRRILKYLRGGERTAGDLAEQGRRGVDHDGGNRDSVLLWSVFGDRRLAGAARGGLRLQNLWCLKGIRLRWRCSGTSSIPTRALRRR